MSSGCFSTQAFQLLTLTLVSLVILWGSFHYYREYLQLAPEGTVVHGQDASGLRRSEVGLLIQQSSHLLQEKTFTLVLSENGLEKTPFSFSLAELGMTYDVPFTISAIFDQEAFSAQADVLGVHAAADEANDLPLLNTDDVNWEALFEVVRSHERSVRDASLLFDEEAGKWVFQEHQVGLRLLDADEALFREQLLALAAQGFPETSLELVLERVEPKVRSEELQPLYEHIQSLLATSYTWKLGEEVISFSFEKAPEALRLDLAQRRIEIDESALRAFFAPWAEKYEQAAGKVLAKDPVPQEKGYLKSEYEGDFVSGKVLDLEAILHRILSGEVSEVVPQLPFLYLEPEVALEGVGKLSLLARGQSSYALAHGEEREFNVRFGLSKYDGVVVPQGAEFNFNQILGWVTYEAGWKPALAIFGGGGVRPVPGGGLCQVSTTMYRAVINSGLPVTARKPHSLDVSYYHAYGYGIDSTVYPPEDINLKFVNDTPGPILIHTIMDEVNKEAFVEFYGIDDGREVELRQVINREVVLPNQVTYTSELPAGIQEVLQRGRTGRYIEWEWVIKRADGTVEQRAIETLYPAAARTVRVGMGG